MDRPEYLEQHHDLTETMLGLVSLRASPELMGELRPYRDKLQILWINYLIDNGVPAEEIGQRKTFYADDALVAQAMEARQGEDAEERLHAKHDSAVGEADVPKSSSPNPYPEPPQQ